MMGGEAPEIPDTISRFETVKGGIQSATPEAVQCSPESAGIEFIDQDGGGTGMPLDKH